MSKVLVGSCAILWITVMVTGSPPAPMDLRIAGENFQKAVQQQTFQSVLMSIEERLRNLDNIYSMQLSETLKSKLDQYHRKLESLDSKIVRLESVMTLNLDKLSENISIKNYKDDVAKTQTYRKMDSMYDGLSHKINYMDKKYDMALEKIQNKLDASLHRLEEMDEHMMQRNADIEAELSETLFVIDDFKSGSMNAENNLLNITSNILNHSLSNTVLISSINSTMEKIIKELGQSISVKLEELENKTSETLEISSDSNRFLKGMKLELKNDFNDYANKVADMNTDIWKRNDLAETSLDIIENVANSTKTEVRNGIRALMLQIGKISGKDIVNNDKDSLDSFKKSINLNLEKILTNQGLFLESCHRVQMDESQIESEISAMLEKLIDMLEKKMTTLMKDLKGLEKTMKNQDSRINRNLYQANTNVVSLFEKTTKSYEIFEKELQEIKFHVNSLFSFVQNVLPENQGLIPAPNNIESTLNELSISISNLIQLINSNKNSTKWDQLEKNFMKHHKISDEILNRLKNISEILIDNEISVKINSLENTTKQFKDVLAGLSITNSNMICSLRKTENTEKIAMNNYTQNYRPLIDIRADIDASNDNTQSISKSNLRENNHKRDDSNVDIFTTSLDKKIHENIFSEKNNINANKTKIQLELENDQNIAKNILEIFGAVPYNSSIKTISYNTKGNGNKKCRSNFASQTDITSETNSKDDNCNNESIPKIFLRHDDGTATPTNEEKSSEYYEETSTEGTTTESYSIPLNSTPGDDFNT